MDVVLVHGAWQGAWCWERLSPLLRSAGHRVLTPTLTGSGDRADELSPEVDLATHVDDVAICIDDSAAGVVLVAHSYAGMLVPDVIGSRPGAVHAVVFVDAFYPDDGLAAVDQMPPAFRDLFRDRARTEGGGWRLPAGETLLDVWGVHDPATRRWIGERLTDWSLRCFESPCTTSRRVLADVPRWYVGGNAEYPARSAFRAIAEVADIDGATCSSLDTGHDVMVEDPEGLAAVVRRAIDAA